MNPLSLHLTGAAATMLLPAAGRPMQRRWAIWGEQARAGHEPCYGTERRLTCEEIQCPWRRECLALRAVWRR